MRRGMGQPPPVGRKGLLAALALLALSAPATAAPAPAGTLPAEAAPSALRLCFESTPLLPWRTREKRGLYFDLLGEVAKRTAVRFEYVPMPWRNCLEQLRDGRMDGAFAVAFSEERLPIVRYPPGAPESTDDALREDDVLLIRRRGSSAGVRGTTLVGTQRPVSVQRAYAIADDLARLGWPLDDSARDHLRQLSALVEGRVDLVALNEFRWRQLQTVGAPGLATLEALPTPILSKRYFLVFSHPFVADHPVLAERLWTTTREVRQSPAYLAREAVRVERAMASSTSR